MSAAGDVGGVIVLVAGKRAFVPASTAIKVLPMPVVARVPGGPRSLVGVALVEGEMVPVVAVAELVAARGQRDNRPMLLCAHGAERVGLVGLEVLATGKFPGDARAIEWNGEAVPAFDLGPVFARLEEGRWVV
ncbi:MAG: chemotaxis protein CheW [Deltaproteobacteria bacterium]|nr:chemotaxis protein CheW [Deltaproteobacteria bacterium]